MRVNESGGLAAALCVSPRDEKVPCRVLAPISRRFDVHLFFSVAFGEGLVRNTKLTLFFEQFVYFWLECCPRGRVAVYTQCFALMTTPNSNLFTN